MKQSEGKELKNVFRNIALILFLCELLFWILINISANFVYDQDAAKLMYHSIKMWEGKSFALPNWAYVSSGEWDCSSLLAMPIYGITGNIFLSFGISNIIGILLFSLLVLGISRTVGMKEEYAFLALDIILLPYTIGMLEYTNMLFWGGAQYMYKISIPLLLVYILHAKLDKKWIRSLIVALLLFLVFVTVTASGIYVVACGIVPVILFELCYHIDRRKVQKYSLVIISAVLLDIVFSLVIHQVWGAFSKADEVSLITIGDLYGNIVETFLDSICLTGIFTLESTPVVSLNGIIVFAKLFLYLFVCYFGLKNAGKLKNMILSAISEEADKPNADLREVVQLQLLSISLGNFLILILSETTSRYHIVGYIPLIIVALMSFEEKKCRVWCRGLVFAVVIFLGVFLGKDFLNRYVKPEFDRFTCEQIIAIADAAGAEQIISYNSTKLSEYLRVYDSDMECISYNEKVYGFYDLDVYNNIRGMDEFYKKSILLTTNGEVPSLEGYTDQYIYLGEVESISVFMN